MNVKTAASILGKGQTHIIDKCRALGFEKKKGQYHITDADLELLKKRLARKPPKSNTREIAILNSVPMNKVKGFSCRLGLSIKHDREKIMRAFKLQRTGYYTLKGIKWMLTRSDPQSL